MIAAIHRFIPRFAVWLSLVFLVGMSAIVSGCASDSLARDPTLGWSADKLYAEAKEEMSAGNWAAAIKLLEKLESRYPFGRYAQQAQIDTAFAQWKDKDNAQALAAVDRFLKLYPNHDSVDYVLYLKGLINFNDRETLFTNVTGEDMAERDPKAAREAFDTFKELINRFPKSQYAEDATLRMNFLLNMLASNDVHVARFYMRRGATLAAVNRAQAVVKQYQETPATEEALAIMVAGYKQLAMDNLSADARRVLEKNFPNSIYLKVNYDPNIRGGTDAGKPSTWQKIKPW